MLTIDLTGKTAFVVGGSRGIGAGIVETLALAGAKVTFSHTGNPANKAAIDELQMRTSNLGNEAEAVVVNACDEDSMQANVEQIIAKRGKIDILVHNVGQNVARPVESIPLEEWQHFLDLNLTSAFISVKSVLPPMLSAGYGRIVLIGSSAVYSGGGGAIDYAAAKSGLVGMMAYLSKGYARKGILTNVIHPCVIETELLRERYSTEADKAMLVSQIPAGRLGQPSDIAGMVAYLASKWGDYICGQAIMLDGGRTLFG